MADRKDVHRELPAEWWTLWMPRELFWHWGRCLGIGKWAEAGEASMSICLKDCSLGGGTLVLGQCKMGLGGQLFAGSW